MKNDNHPIAAFVILTIIVLLFGCILYSFYTPPALSPEVQALIDENDAVLARAESTINAYDDFMASLDDTPPSETKKSSAVSLPSVLASTGEKNALKKAEQYLRYSAFSKEGLIEQLEYEGYSHTEAKYGAENCGADWYEQAAKKAEQYLKYSAFSEESLIEQLEYEGFTSSEAKDAVENCGADWYEQAVKKAAQYLKYSAFSEERLIEQLEYEGFSHAQAVYGAGKNGY